MTEHIPATHFETAAVAPGDQFDAWREVISVVFDVAPTAEGTGEGFSASARAFHLGELLLVDTRFDRQQFLRTPRQVRSDWLDHYLVQYYREGGYVGEVGGEGLEIRPGSVSVLDLAQPLHTHATAAECLSLVVPRDVMAALVPGADQLHGRILAGAGSRLLGDHLASLERELAHLPAARAPDIASATGLLMAACLRPDAGTVAAARPLVDPLLFVRARRHIDACLDDPRLGEPTPAALCRAIGTSRSRLYALFKPRGGVRHYVQGRRLARLHAALADPREQASIMVLAERFGFASHAHASRLFRQRYGYRPSDVRADPASVLQARAAGASPGRAESEYAPGAAGFDDWIRALRN